MKKIRKMVVVKWEVKCPQCIPYPTPFGSKGDAEFGAMSHYWDTRHIAGVYKVKGSPVTDRRMKK